MLGAKQAPSLLGCEAHVPALRKVNSASGEQHCPQCPLPLSLLAGLATTAPSAPRISLSLCCYQAQRPLIAQLCLPAPWSSTPPAQMWSLEPGCRVPSTGEEVAAAGPWEVGKLHVSCPANPSTL